MVSGHPQDVAILLHGPLNICSIVCWIGANADANGLENTKTSLSLMAFRTWTIQLVTILCYLGSKQRQ
jgi:hypothetical protein